MLGRANLRGGRTLLGEWLLCAPRRASGGWLSRVRVPALLATSLYLANSLYKHIMTMIFIYFLKLNSDHYSDNDTHYATIIMVRSIKRLIGRGRYGESHPDSEKLIETLNATLRVEHLWAVTQHMSI
jgi:hypothetical protein